MEGGNRKRGKLSRKLKLLVTSGIALGLAARCAAEPTPDVLCYAPVAPTPTETPMVMCYEPPPPIEETPTLTPTATLTDSAEITPTPTLESRRVLMERLLTAGRFPEGVMKVLKE
jgi:hypothetical protein